MKRKIHFNCDMGEGISNEAELMPYIHAANIACGGHAGDAQTMEQVMDLALHNDVQIGIHPSYPDRKNFGRKKLEISNSECSQALKIQFESFLNISEQKNITVNHIKPHGALYHALSQEPELCNLFLEECMEYLPNVKMYGAPNSLFLQMALSTGFIVMPEGFADRRYNENGQLVSRNNENAIISDAQESYGQIINLWHHDRVQTEAKEFVNIKVETICIHGDHEGALENLHWFWKHYAENDATR